MTTTLALSYGSPDELISGLNALFSGSATTINEALAIASTNSLQVNLIQPFRERFAFNLVQGGTSLQTFYGSSEELIADANTRFTGSATTINGAVALFAAHDLYITQLHPYPSPRDYFGGNFAYFMSASGDQAALTPFSTNKDAVQLATEAALPAGTYSNGVNNDGLGATFTVTATGTLTVDGVLTTKGMRILAKNQVSGLQDGIYVVTTAGASGVSAVLTRTEDMNNSSQFVGSTVYVVAGTVNTGGVFSCTNTAAPTVGTTAITFASLALATPTLDAVPTAVGPVNLGGETIIDLANPTTLTGGANAQFVQAGKWAWAADTGSANAYATAPVPAVTAYDAGLMVTFKVGHLNTGPSTIAVSGLATKAIQKTGGTALAGGEMVAGDTVLLIFDGTAFQLIGNASA